MWAPGATREAAVRQLPDATPGYKHLFQPLPVFLSDMRWEELELALTRSPPPASTQHGNSPDQSWYFSSSFRPTPPVSCQDTVWLWLQQPASLPPQSHVWEHLEVEKRLKRPSILSAGIRSPLSASATHRLWFSARPGSVEKLRRGWNLSHKNNQSFAEPNNNFFLLVYDIFSLSGQRATLWH